MTKASCPPAHAYSNATCLWQKVLWAHGLLDWSDIDGIYGTKTATATYNYQYRRLLSSWDGIAGRETFTDAMGHPDWLRDTNGDGNPDEYVARKGFKLTRDANGRYKFYDAEGNARLAYNYLTCS
ncbi:peptidoglycan-binding domain-containing protein [Streptomyces sp. HMX87]|uniref:peptidoglycan-binding domain-containing protein n=1 Tax=Streptomyces sp. HMX87 TaxID=3390849 RepID=UPI003A8AD6B5